MRHLFSPQASGGASRLAIATCFLLVSLVTVLLEASLGLTVVHAAGGEEARFGLQPVLYDPSNPLTKSYFIFNGKPGAVVKSFVRVINIGTARGSVNLYAVDATTGQTSGAVYLNRNEPRKDVGSWLTLGTQQLTLDPGEGQIVSFQITIPSASRPGQHLGGIVAENLAQQSSISSSDTKKNTSNIQINIKNLTIMAVQVNLPGAPVEQLVDMGVQVAGENSYQQLLVGLSNTGTVMLKPFGTLQITDGQGHVVENFSFALDTFLPQTAINYPLAIKGTALGVGNYQATLNLSYGHGKTLHSISKFSINQQQLKQIFSSSRTQAPPGLDDGPAGMPLWQILLIAGCALYVLWRGGNMVYRRILPRLKAKRSNT